MSGEPYLARVADAVLDRALEASGAVLIEGPKWCGKTRTAEHRAASAVFLQDPDRAEGYLRAADTKPSLLLAGDVPRLIDEWQTAPVLWDAVRFAVDRRAATGQFILTGSAVPRDGVTRHTGTGRIARLLLRPMSLYASGESNGAVSLGDLFDGSQQIACLSSLSVEALAFALSRGGWPATVQTTKPGIGLRRVFDYVDAVVDRDVSRVDGVSKNPARVRALLRSLARHTATQASLATIRADLEVDAATVSDKTVTAYLDALRRIFVVEDLAAWNPALRSKTPLRTSLTRHFVDPSIAVAALRASPAALLADFNTFGLLFESLCVRDLRVYAQALDGEVFHYRDKTGLEADAVVQLKDGRWGAVEVKMGIREADRAADHLIALRDRVDTQRLRPASFLMVLTATEVGYRRPDGVLVVPIGCLRP
jgi:predicted AAA+ superfamily ATPase